MDKMRIDLYLPEKLQRRIDAKKVRYAELTELALGSGSPSEAKVRVMTSAPQAARFEDIIIKKAELEKTIKSLIRRISAAKMDIIRVAEVMEEDERELILMRYVELLSILEISGRLRVSYRTVQRRLKKAKRSFEDAEGKVRDQM